jgi:hypothetical protein
MRDMRKIGFRILLFLLFLPIIIYSFEFEYAILEKPRFDDIISLDYYTKVNYCFNINYGWYNPFITIKDSTFTPYQNNFNNIYFSSIRQHFIDENIYNDTILTTLYYGRCDNFYSTIIGGSFIRDYFLEFSGKTAFTNISDTYNNRYLFYQNIHWENRSLPITVSFNGNYYNDTLNYIVRLFGVSQNTYLDFCYKKSNLYMTSDFKFKKYRALFSLNTEIDSGDFLIGYQIKNTPYNILYINYEYKMYQNLQGASLSYICRMNEKSLTAYNIRYYIYNHFDVIMRYISIKPYFDISFNYKHPDNMFSADISSIYTMKYLKGYVYGHMDYDTTFSYEATLLNILPFKFKEAITISPGFKFKLNNNDIDILPIAHLKFIDAHFISSYDFINKNFSLVAKWDFYN